jgi:hypothetical protein
MNSMNRPVDRPGATLASMFSSILRFFAALAGALLMVAALLVGLLVGLTLILFTLLRGRKPQDVKFVWRKGDWPGRPGSRQGMRAVDPGEVVDIEARELAPRQPQDS